MPPLLGNLTVFTIDDASPKKPITPLGEDSISFDVELKNLRIDQFTLGTTPIVTIDSGKCLLNLTDVTLKVMTDYSFISDPPIFADIGDATILISGLTASSAIQT